MIIESGKLNIPAEMRGGESDSEMKGATYMCMELCIHGNLASLIKAGDGIEKEKLLKNMFVQICQGVSDLHVHAGFTHMNLSCEKVLVGDDLTMKICDMSAATEISKDNSLIQNA